MSECYIEDAEGQCECGNCDWSGDASELELISDIQSRLNAGGTVPAGQCPECGALAYLTTSPSWTPEAQLEKLHPIAAALLAALQTAESFMAGFEGDELQEGIDSKLKEIRAAISAAEAGNVAPASPARVLITVSGGIADYETHGAVDVDTLDFDNLESEGLTRAERNAEYLRSQAWLQSGAPQPEIAHASRAESAQ